MRLSYDPKTDVLQIRLRSSVRMHSEEIDPGVSVSVDDAGRIVGFVIEDARKRLSLEELTTVSYENVATQKRSTLSLP